MLLCLALVTLMGRVGEVGVQQRRTTNHGVLSVRAVAVFCQ